LQRLSSTSATATYLETPTCGTSPMAPRTALSRFPRFANSSVCSASNQSLLSSPLSEIVSSSRLLVQRVSKKSSVEFHMILPFLDPRPSLVQSMQRASAMNNLALNSTSKPSSLLTVPSTKFAFAAPMRSSSRALSSLSSRTMSSQPLFSLLRRSRFGWESMS
jgi:hypothetical protein